MKTTERLARDPYNIVITGVGGQGNVMASRVLSNMLVRRGFRITIGETFGMSQRGGAVMSHIRVSARSQWSPQIPRGRADLVVALEPVEALRVLTAYGHSGVKVVINTRPIYPVGVITGALDYPPLGDIEDSVRSLSSGAWFLDATDEALKLGNPILGNIIMIGAATAIRELPVSRDDFQEVIRQTLTPDKLAVNLQAFDIGAAKVETRREGRKRK
jgi:indolepyruvate ferredoxin oxidoreductase beta subunit